MNKSSRRQFLAKSTLLTCSTFFSGLMIQGCGVKKAGLPPDISKENAPVLPSHIPEVIDKEVWFINSKDNNAYRPVPADPAFRYFSGFSAIPNVQSVPFPWGKENFS